MPDPVHDDPEGIGFPAGYKGYKEPCDHDLQPTGEEYLTQLDNVSRLTRFVKCKKCGIEAIDVFVYIGTFEKSPDSKKFEG